MIYIFQFPNGFSQQPTKAEKQKLRIIFQFPNGFSHDALRQNEKMYKLATFNSLTDSHFGLTIGSWVYEELFFQFPNGFSLIGNELFDEDHYVFQFPNGFSLLCKYNQQQELVLSPFNSLTDSHMFPLKF